MIKLLNKDCFDFLKNIEDKSIDLILIDPPYNISRDSNFASGKETGRDTDRFRISIDFGKWDSDFDYKHMEILAKEFYRILKKGGTLICFYDLWKISYLKTSLEKAKFKQLRFVEWVKTNPVPINSKVNYLTNSREIAICAVKGGKPVFNSSYDNGIYEYPICQDKGRFHPTQKPLKLIEELLRKHSNECDIVLDCFSGSATTAVACIKTNRNFVGCEISKEYYQKAIERINAEIKNTTNSEKAN